MALFASFFVFFVAYGDMAFALLRMRSTVLRLASMPSSLDSFSAKWAYETPLYVVM